MLIFSSCLSFWCCGNVIKMARTRRQQEQDERREAASARAASRRWSKPELLRLLRAWRHALRHAQTRFESSDKIAFRLYNRFHALASEVDNNGDNASNTEARPLRDAIAISQATQILKRTFRFISEYNQKHHGTSGISINNDGDNSQDNNSRTNTAKDGVDRQHQQENGSPYSRPWFQLTAKERQKKFMQGQRNRRANSFMDIDEEMFKEMTVIMTQTMHQLKRIRADSSKSSLREGSSELSLSEQPWSSAEIWQLLHAWRETIEEPHKPRVHSPEFLAQIFQRFVDICEGNTQRTIASVRHRKSSLVSLFTLIKQISSRCEADRDWFSLTAAERLQIYADLNRKLENYSELDRGMFSMLTFILKLEDDSYLVGNHHHLQQRKQQQQEVEEEASAGLDQHDGFSNYADDTIDLVSDYEYPSEDEAEDDQDGHSSEREETASYFAGHGVEQSSGAPLTEHADNNCDTSRDIESNSNDGIEVPEHFFSRKKRRLDPELLSIVSILEKEAKHLRAMLLEAKEERELDREERRRLWEQMKQDQEDKRRERAEWRLEKKQLLQELVWLRNQHR